MFGGFVFYFAVVAKIFKKFPKWNY